MKLGLGYCITNGPCDMGSSIPPSTPNVIFGGNSTSTYDSEHTIFGGNSTSTYDSEHTIFGGNSTSTYLP